MPLTSKQSRKPIYDDVDLPPTRDTAITAPTRLDPPTPTKPRGPSPTDRLAVQIGRTRKFLYTYAVKAEDAVNGAMDRAFHLEQSFTTTVASLAPPRESGEKLMPGVLYVLVATMAGSILARNRNILARAALPLALGVGAAWTVLPVTSRNVADLAWTYEKRFPAVADAHVATREAIEKGWSFAKVHTRVGAQYVDDKVTGAREAVEDWVKKGK